MTFLDLLCEIAECPLTGAPLVPVEPDELVQLNERAAEGSLRHANGTHVAERLSDAVASVDRPFVYRVDESIAALLPQLAIRTGADGPKATKADPQKRVVHEFYETFGWRTKNGEYLDTIAFVDRRPVSMQYLARCHRRIREHMSRGGRFILDAASGPVQFPEYRRLSEGFDFRVCVDFSRLALEEAKRNLGAHGLYILGDVTKLPFRTGVFDAAVSLHTIYHVPAEEQRLAFEELHRVVKPGAKAVVVYQWGPGLARRALLHAFQASRVGRRRASPATGSAAPPQLYAHSHTYRWFRRQRWPFDADVRAWRSVGSGFLRRYVGDGLAGRTVVRALQLFEEHAPHLAGRVGRYPLIVIEKRLLGGNRDEQRLVPRQASSRRVRN